MEVECFVFIEALLLNFGSFKLAWLADLTSQVKFSRVSYLKEGV